MSIRTAFLGVVFLLTFSLTASFTVAAQTKRKTVTPGQKAIVVDERLSALRTQPDVKAPLEQRLRRGRVVGILGARKSSEGQQFLRVSVTRNTRGWVLAESVVKSGNAADAERLLKLLEDTDDDFIKARLARLCADEFRSTASAPRCLLKLGEAAERAAERLTRDAKRRAGNEEPSAGLSKRDYFLNFNGLDRYNRIGLTFDYRENADRIVYDGAAYRELLKKYATSDDSPKARERLEALGKK
ncbi:MAG: SH3 domain-containing protein [Blastocatellia bacterium]